MNYKKGIARLFIIGLVLSSIIGFGLAFDDMRDIRNGMDSASSGALMAIKDPECIKSIKEDTTYSNPLPLWMNCKMLKIYWKDLEKYQGDPPDFDGVRIALSNMSAIKQAKTWLLATTNTFIIFIALSVLAIGIFFIYKWIIKGFKSQ